MTYINNQMSNNKYIHPTLNKGESSPPTPLLPSRNALKGLPCSPPLRFRGRDHLRHRLPQGHQVISHLHYVGCRVCQVRHRHRGPLQASLSRCGRLSHRYASPLRDARLVQVAPHLDRLRCVLATTFLPPPRRCPLNFSCSRRPRRRRPQASPRGRKPLCRRHRLLHERLQDQEGWQIRIHPCWLEGEDYQAAQREGVLRRSG